MREIELPASIVPGSPEAVAFIERMVPTVAPEELSPGEQIVTIDALPGDTATGYDLVIAGLEQMIDGFKELRNA